MPTARSTVVVTLMLVVTGVSFAVLHAGVRADPPAWVPAASAPQSNVQTIAGVRHITTPQAAFALMPDSGAPAPGARLLWLEGRVASHVGDSSVVVDRDGRILSIDRALRAHPHALARPGGWRAATITPTGDVWLTDQQGNIVRVDGRGVQHALPRGPFDAPSLAASSSGNQVWLVRSTDQLAGAIDSIAGPLIVAVDSLGRVRQRVGRAHRPAHALLEAMENAGHVVARDSMLFFAPFIRDQLVALGQRGDTLWVSSRALSYSTSEPRFEVQDGRVVVDYHPVNLGLAHGPDGLLYLLSLADVDMSGTRLDVFDPGTGQLLRTAVFNTISPTIAVDADGRVHALDASVVLGSDRQQERHPSPSINLKLLQGGGISSDTLRGRLVLVNLWASWCAPCRTEMPALDSLQQRLVGRNVVFLSINEDIKAVSARAFMSRGKFTFPVALGGPRMHLRFGAAGLPATILIDRDGREIRRWVGYAGPAQIEEIGEQIEAELRGGATAPTAPPPAHTHRH